MSSIVKMALEGQFDNVVRLSLEEEAELTEEINNDQLEILTNLDEAERVLEITSALEDLAFVASDIKKLSPREAALIQISSDLALAGSDVDGESLVPSMEAMDDPQSLATKIKAIIARVIKWVKEKLVWIREKLENFIDSNVVLARSKRKQCKDLIEKVKKTSTGSSGKFEAVPLYRAKPNGDAETILSGSEMIAALKNQTAVIENLVRNGGQYLAQNAFLTHTLYREVKAGKDADKKIAKIIEDYNDPTRLDWLGNVSRSGRIPADLPKDEVASYVCELLDGFSIIGFTVVDRAVRESKEPAVLAYSFTKATSNGIKTYRDRFDIEAEFIPAFSRDQALEILKYAQKLLEQCVDISAPDTLVGDFNTYTKKYSKMTEDVSAILKSYPDDDPRSLAYAQSYEKVASQLNASVGRIYSTTVTSCTSLATHCMKLVEKSLAVSGTSQEKKA